MHPPHTAATPAASELTPSQQLRRAWASWWSIRFSDSENVPLWAMVVVTVLWNTAFGIGITAFVWVFSGGRLELGRMLWMNVLTAQCIGFLIFGLFQLAARVVGSEVIDRWRGWRRAVFFSLVPLAGVGLGYAIALFAIGQIEEGFSVRWFSGWWVAGALLVWALVSAVMWRLYMKELRIAETEQQLAANRARASELERQALDAQLRALQAQIEPHFLFNTLANVVSLIDAQPQDARRMLERLIALLRGSLSASRADNATLGEEFDLCRAYLDILAIRMGSRLQYSVEIEPGLRPLRVAPMLLQPLVENAIQHGLEPKVDGGRVALRARAQRDAVEVIVEDDGVGFGALTRGGGVGLSNLRERLASLHAGARLVIEDAQPGTRVRLLLPVLAPAPAAALATAA